MQRDEPQPMPMPDETHQRPETSDWLSAALHLGGDDEPLALPVFDADTKVEQFELIRVIGRRMFEARELCNMSQLVAAKRFGYANSSKLSKVEGATDTNSVPLWLIARAARLYEVSIDFLFGLSDDWETGAGLGEQAFLLEAWEAARRRDLSVLLALRRDVADVSKMVPALNHAAEQVIEAIQRFRELNAGFDDEMRGGARLVAAGEALLHQTREALRASERFHLRQRSPAMTNSGHQQPHPTLKP